MKLFKNVDLVDLLKILAEGIKPLDQLEENNWESGKRANNATDVVYLFSPVSERNSFPHYGAVLLEIETTATRNEIAERDSNKGLYEEYITDYVHPSQIKKAYLPSIFKNRKEVKSHANLITWCEMSANYYPEESGFIHPKTKATEEILTLFGKTANFDGTCDNHFRGMFENRTMIELYDVVYKI